LPRITPSVTGGAATADRVLSLLTAFQHGDIELTLAELSLRTGLYKSTALRLLHSLEGANLLDRTRDGSFRLGAEILRLYAILGAADGLEAAVMPVLLSLVATTRETAALHVKRGQHRERLYWVDSPQSLREHLVPGEELPLDRGAGGLVLRAFSGARGGIAEKIRRQGYAISIGGRLPELSGISAPVFDARGDLAGALTLTMPTQRWKSAWRSVVVAKARELTRALGGTTSGKGRLIIRG
jgi:DNA-binding IclR family transcriptional regulator